MDVNVLCLLNFKATIILTGRTKHWSEKYVVSQSGNIYLWRRKACLKLHSGVHLGLKKMEEGACLGRESNKTRQDSLETFIRGGTGCKYNQKVQTCTHPVWLATSCTQCSSQQTETRQLSLRRVPDPMFKWLFTPIENERESAALKKTYRLQFDICQPVSTREHVI